jgi:hypothetical protein
VVLLGGGRVGGLDSLKNSHKNYRFFGVRFRDYCFKLNYHFDMSVMGPTLKLCK